MIVLITSVFGAILFFVILVSLLHKNFRRRTSKYLKNVPGPEPNSLFGNMLEFAVPTHQFLDVIGNYIEKYGPILRIFDGPLSAVVVVSEEKFMEYILSSTQIIEKSKQYDYFHNWLGTGLLTSKGQKWKKRRRMLTPAFHFSILENFIDVFEKVGDIFIKKLEQHVGKESFDIYPLVSLYTLDVICEAAMGTYVNAQNDNSSKYVQSVKKICAIITDRNFSPLDTRFYPLTPNFYREYFALKVLHSHTDDVIERKLKDMKNCDKKINEADDLGIKKRMAFLDLLLRSTIDGKPLSKKDIREEVDTFMFEGHDTTSSALSFALYSLANNPHVQNKAFEEQSEIFGGNENIKPTVTDLQKMKYLELVIKETLRLYPPVPFFARKVTEEFEWENSIYPKGIQLIIFPYMSQRNPKYYPNPLEFNPERFSDYAGTNPYRYIPFSAGPRNCIGQKFAMLEMKSTISKVIRSFELLPANPNVDLKLAPELILVSKSGVNVSIRKRK